MKELALPLLLAGQYLFPWNLSIGLRGGKQELTLDTYRPVNDRSCIFTFGRSRRLKNILFLAKSVLILSYLQI